MAAVSTSSNSSEAQGPCRKLYSDCIRFDGKKREFLRIPAQKIAYSSHHRVSAACTKVGILDLALDEHDGCVIGIAAKAGHIDSLTHTRRRRLTRIWASERASEAFTDATSSSEIFS